jgi:dipeptidase E
VAKVTLILNGGGDAQQTAAIDAVLAQELPRRTMLYIPHATAPDPWSYDRALAWLKDHQAFSSLEIEMWIKLNERSYSELDDFDAIYLMGGNTFLLLSILRESGFDVLLEKFAASKRVICGISAGAIVLGQSIGTAALGDEADENAVGITNLTGLKMLDGYYIHTHYTDNDSADIMIFTHSNNRNTKVMCIPEDSGVVVTDSDYRVVGQSPVVIYTNDGQQSVTPGSVLPRDGSVRPKSDKP